jgi:hypothetical protein
MPRPEQVSGRKAFLEGTLLYFLVVIMDIEYRARHLKNPENT